MLDLEGNQPVRTRKHDISSWQEVDLRGLSPQGQKRFQTRQAAIIAYFTTDEHIKNIVQRYHISPRLLFKLVQQSLMPHEDGTPWGFRALLPAVSLTDQASDNAPLLPEETNPPSRETGPIQKISLSEGTATSPAEQTAPEGSVGADLSSPLPIYRPSSPHESTKPQQSSPPPQTPASTHDPEPAEQHQIPKTTAQVQTRQPEQQIDPITEEISLSSKEASHKEASQSETVQPSVPTLILPGAKSIDTFGFPVYSPSVGAASGKLDHDPLSEYCNSYQQPSSSIDIKKLAHQRRMIRRRRARETQEQGKRKRFYSIVSTISVTIILFGIVFPLIAGLAAYSLYNNLYTNANNLAHDGLNHLLAVKNLLPASQDDLLSSLDAQKLQQAQTECKSAENDFVQLQQLVDRPDLQSMVQQFAPSYTSKLLMAQHLVHVALDVSRMGQEVSHVGLIAASIIHGSPLATTLGKPLISPADISAMQGAMVHALYYIDDINTQMNQVQVKDLPLNDKQKTELNSVFQRLPKIRSTIAQAQDLIGIVAWLLGSGQERHFLVQTMDSGELRPGGGFTGQYGVLQVKDGRMAPFTLRDVALLDYAGNGIELGRLPPPEYRNWMTFGNWGLRDSNLSADFPTTARMSMQVFQEEGGGPVDGDIAFTPTFIGHIIDATGPISVAAYNETITSQNLEARLHYYQQDFSAIAREKQISGDTSHQARKSFTSLLGSMLLDRVRHLPTKKLLDLLKNSVKDIQSRDLEIYFANPLAEQWLIDHGYSGSMDTFSQQDGFMVVQANISASKASDYVHTTEEDHIVIDPSGTATHNLTITLDYQPTGPIYGYDTYADYIRVYAPSSAQYISGDGFDSGQCLPVPGAVMNAKCCVAGAITAPATQNQPNTGDISTQTGCDVYKHSFPSSARYCPNGIYDLGDRSYQHGWTYDSLGPPTSWNSDLPGRAMWGGLTETPRFCTSTISLSWRVPNAVKHNSNQPSYHLLVQKQGGYIPTVIVKVDSAISGLKPLNINENLTADKTYSMN